MNTHPTHTQVGGWGLQPMVVRFVVVVVVCVGFWCVCVFLGCWCVCVMGVLLFLRHFRFYIHLNNIGE